MMIKLIRSSQRHHVRCGKRELWHSFLANDLSGPLDGGFGFLLAFDEIRLQPGASTEPHCDDEAEIVTYVYKGALSQEDTVGSSGVIHTGEFQRMSTGLGIRHKETSVSRTASAHLFRISLRSAQAGLDRGDELKRFTEAQRRNQLCVVVSPDGRKGSLRIRQDVVICSAILEPGRHFMHELGTDRSAWLHVVCGEATVNDLVLTTGDSVGVKNERLLALTIQKPTEILLVDLGPVHLRPWEQAMSEPRPT